MILQKTKVSEEEILSRQKQALEAGLSLFRSSYESHDIQDSDSEDDDSPRSVIVYILA